MRHHHLQHHNSIKLNKLYSTLLKFQQKFSFINFSDNCKKKNFRKYDVITVCALICAVREKLDIILSITPTQTWGRFCDYLLTYDVIDFSPSKNVKNFLILKKKRIMKANIIIEINSVWDYKQSAGIR